MNSRIKAFYFFSLVLTIACMVYASTHYICKGHIFSGDYALYIAEAKSLLNGTQQKIWTDMNTMIKLSTYQYYSPQLYPWGLPVLLALPTAIFGTNYFVYKMFLFIFLLLTIIVLFKDFHLQNKEKAGAVVLLLLGLNTVINQLTILVISTIPYMFFLYLSFYVIRQIFIIDQKNNRKTILLYCILGLLLFITIQIRIEGVLLLLALLIQQLCFIPRKKERRRKYILQAIIPYVIFILLFVATLPIFPIGFNTYSTLARGLKLNIFENYTYYIKQTPALCLTFLRPNNLFAICLFWIFVIFGALNSSRSLLTDKMYLCFYFFALVFCWPFQETRFISPLVPLLLYFLITGALSSLEFIMPYKKQMWVYLAVFILCLGEQYNSWKMDMKKCQMQYNNFDVNIDSQKSQDVLSFIREKTSKNAIIGCSESRSIYLYTSRLSCNLSSSIEDTRKKADWYVEFNNRGNYLQHFPDDLRYKPEIFEQVYENSDFTVYKIIK